MKKMMILLAGVLVLGTATARVDYDRPTTIDRLPAKAQQFIKAHFANEKPAFAKEERDFLEETYEVVFVNGQKLEFRKNGDWKEVDCRYAQVPASIVPAQLAAKVKELYPQAQITKIDRDSRDYELHLNNGLELTFDLKYNLIEIDD